MQSVMTPRDETDIPFMGLKETLEGSLRQIGQIQCTSPVDPNRYFYVKDLLSNPQAFLTQYNLRKGDPASKKELAVDFAIATAQGIKFDTLMMYGANTGIDPLNHTLSNPPYSFWGIENHDKPTDLNFGIRKNIYNLLILGSHTKFSDYELRTDYTADGEKRRGFWNFHGSTRRNLVDLFGNEALKSDLTLREVNSLFRSLIAEDFKIDRLFRALPRHGSNAFNLGGFLPSVFSELNALVALRKIGVNAVISEGYQDRKGIDIFALWNGARYAVQVKGRTNLSPDDGIHILSPYQIRQLVLGDLESNISSLDAIYDVSKMSKFIAEIEILSEQYQLQGRHAVHPLWVYASSVY